MVLSSCTIPARLGSNRRTEGQSYYRWGESHGSVDLLNRGFVVKAHWMLEDRC